MANHPSDRGEIDLLKRKFANGFAAISQNWPQIPGGGFSGGDDRKQGIPWTRYSPRLLFFLTLIAGLNVLDSFFTTMILDLGGQELNPIVSSAMELCGDHFWIWKQAVVSLNLIALCHYSKFRYVTPLVAGLALVFSTLVLYQITLLSS